MTVDMRCATCFTVDSEENVFQLVRMQLSADIRLFTEANKVRRDKICRSFCDVVFSFWTNRLLCGLLLFVVNLLYWLFVADQPEETSVVSAAPQHGSRRHRCCH